MMISKEVSVSSAAFKVCGYASDPYFENVETHLQHGFLIPLLAHHLKRRSSLIDVGANIGGTTALMHTFVEDARIVSIEPSRVFACLEATVAANAFANTRCVNVCVGERDGFVDFVDCGDYAGASGRSASHSHIGSGAGVGRALPVRKLDTIARELGLDAVDFVKIDVEGFEENVLDGMRMINETYRPMIFMEFNAFTLAVHAKRSPFVMLERIRDQFGGFIATSGGQPIYCSTDNELAGFLYDNMTKNGCVEDIVFSASPDLRAAFAL